MNKHDTVMLNEAAKKGDRKAQYILGSLFYHGRNDVQQDYAKAAGWFSKAAETGHIGAMLYLGVMYINGQGVNRDYKRALNFLMKAYAGGEGKAAYYIGMMYYRGLSVEKNYKRASQYLQEAADNGDARAEKILNKIQESLSSSSTSSASTNSLQIQDLAEQLKNAIACNDLSTVKSFVSQGADVNFCGKDSITPLIYAAAFMSSSEIMKFLIASGANVNAKDSEGEDALQQLFKGIIHIFFGNDEDIAQTILDINYNSSEGCINAILHNELEKGRTTITEDFNKALELMRILINSGADVNVIVNGWRKRWSMLQFAVTLGNERFVNLLIKAGADINYADEDGYSVLMTAVSFHSSPNIIWILITNGADVHALTKNQFIKAGDLPYNHKYILASKYGVALPSARLEREQSLLDSMQSLNNVNRMIMFKQIEEQVKIWNWEYINYALMSIVAFIVIILAMIFGL